MNRVGPPIRRIIFGSAHKLVSRPNGLTRVDPEIKDLLANPTWSVKSLLPTRAQQATSTITRSQLHHLLKLSALPLPKSQKEETDMLKTLESQIHFVKEVQKVDTTDVEPLVAIRDETIENVKEQMITLEKLEPYLKQEEKVGINGTIRRRKPTEMLTDSGWDPFELGAGKDTRKKGKFFFVKKNVPKTMT